MTEKPYKVKVSVSLDEDVIIKIKEMAENDDRNFSQYINMVLRKHIEDTKK
ncbi:toxin-antitoxin system protein [Lacrimispora sp.]|uniref:toxin-antitoxin system protein n=1 Tax=Lacrimispora sp. TaxID=2719234 RepID=UPI0028A80C09|nr:toxin-antitoxin system protein [Lacrimispora sp.]